MRYIVTLQDFDQRGSRLITARRATPTLAGAWRIAQRWARKGHRLYGANLRRGTFGYAVGNIGGNYRSVVITPTR